MKNFLENSKKKTALFFAALAAFFMISCGSTQNVDKTLGTAENQSAEASENQDEVSYSDAKDVNQKSDITENTTSKNPLETIAEQNIPQNDLPWQSNKENIQNENQNSETEKDSGNQFQTEETISQNPAEKQIQNDEKDEIEAEKIDADELLSNNQNENAPTSDEAEKVSEPNVTEVFEEPEVIEIQDEPEQETETQVSDENPSETENQNEIPDETQNQENLPQNDENLNEAENSEISENDSENQDEENSKNQNENLNENETKNQQNQNETENQNSGLSAENSQNQKLDEASENSENENQETEEELELKENVPSRSVTIKRNQYLDVVYPGNGWVYLGENETSLLRYFGRRIATKNGNTTFSFRSGSKAGDAVLHFYKNDALTGNFIDDYLEVIVEDEIFRGNVRARAPDYAEIVPPKFEKRREEQAKTENLSSPENQNSALQADKNQNSQNPETSVEKSNFSNNQNLRQNSSNDNMKTVISNTDSDAEKAQGHSENFYTQNPAETQTVEENQNFAENVEAEPEVQVEQENFQADESILEKAKELFNEKKYAESLENVQNYINGASTRLDEAYYLLGQLYESNSSIKNVRNAVDAYDTVTKNYPLSKLWRNAKERSIYLKRFYIDIR